MKNLPDKIYLNLGDLTEEEYNELDFNDLSEVTWSEDDVQGRNVEYVHKNTFIERADKFISSFFHPDDTELKKGILDEFHKYMKEK